MVFLRTAAVSLLAALVCPALSLHSSAQASEQGCSVPASSSAKLDVLATLNSVEVDYHSQLLFFYLLRNKTQNDYQITEDSGAVLLLQQRNRKSPLQPVTRDEFRVVYPIVLHPAQQQVIMIRNLRDSYPEMGVLKLNADYHEFMSYEKKVKAYVDRQWPGFGGFILCDPRNQLRIDLPRGW